MNPQVMAGTLTPEQMRMQALVEALRQPAQQPQVAPMQAGQVTPGSTSFNEGGVLDPAAKLLGKGLGKLFSGSGSGSTPTFDTWA